MAAGGGSLHRYLCGTSREKPVTNLGNNGGFRREIGWSE
jgi:hypothetical protein